jgi:hypothetical protein
MSIFEQWDEEFSGIVEDVASYEANPDNNKGGEYEEVPHGTYEVAVETMEIKATKKTNKPMLSMWFRIVEGDFKNSVIFYNQVLEKDFQISMAKKMLKKLVEKCDKAPEIKFDGYAKFNELVMDVHELIADDYEYLLEYKAGKNGFSNYNIKEVYELA